MRVLLAILLALALLTACTAPAAKSAATATPGLGLPAGVTVLEPSATAKVAATAAVQPAAPAAPTVAVIQPTPKPDATPLALLGKGQDVTKKFTLPDGAATLTFSHQGSRNFIVKALPEGGRDVLLVNAVGAYQGSRYLAASGPVSLEIQADGAWTASVAPLASGGQPAFAGKGDAVSALFTPPASGPWQVSHAGTRNFIVYLNCGGNRTLVQNQIGAVSGAVQARFGQGSCLWEVQADGEWSLAPRP
ncbi:MAG: hypothetical protein ACYC4L_09765 [Chloroflexota bacterium]